MSIYQRLRAALEEFYERWDRALDVFDVDDDGSEIRLGDDCVIDDICTDPVPYELTGKAAA